jgi:hypothetical protein
MLRHVVPSVSTLLCALLLTQSAIFAAVMTPWCVRVCVCQRRQRLADQDGHPGAR